MKAPWQQTLLSTLLTPLGQHGPPTVGYRVVASFPHDAGAFTQGLYYEEDRGTLLESTGLYGESSARRVQFESGRVLESSELPADQFGEGLAVCGAECFQLTWRERLCLVRDAATLDLRRTVALPPTMREGWGITHDGAGTLYASDGSSRLHVLSGPRFELSHTVEVTAAGRPLYYLNDLQWVGGEVWANVWHDERIAVIDPRSGAVRCFVDLSGLLTPTERRLLGSDEHVLNGLAHDASSGRTFVTGKCWPRLFEIEVLFDAAAADGAGTAEVQPR